MTVRSNQIRVAIIGGGIGGLTFAIALAKERPNTIIDVYEAQTSFSEFGAGVGLWPRVREVLSAMDLKEDLDRLAPPKDTLKSVEILRGDVPNARPWGSTPNLTGLHRAEFLKILADRFSATANCTAHFSKKLVSYEDLPSGPVRLGFSDGAAAVCDTLIGADGVKSAVRATMYNHLADTAESEEEARKLRTHVDPVWAGMFMYRYLIPREDLEAVCPGHRSLTMPTEYTTNYITSQGIISYPVSNGRWINTAAMVAKHNLFGSKFNERWAVIVDQEELGKQYNDWEEEGRTLIGLMKSPTRWAVNSVPDLPTYASRRVALLGDAAHAMCPYQAVGAGQAIEDGFVLAILLSQVQDNDRIIDALNVYDEVRRPFSQSIQDLSLRTGISLLMNKKGEVALGPDFEYGELEESSEDFSKLYGWSSTTSVMPDRDRALKRYRELTQIVF
ncbi:hypothetical protein EIP91_002960 [Steccherinum ochraceum]|uniref:FAD-binding domain-containing protein n=1 Tax=Steccherinum ochraceum TaxID=92696 RepID=A0A4R0REQ6_9APHY|nr:hypothetical protein EIP91_002960 [Steccherinum ochraceum]